VIVAVAVMPLHVTEIVVVPGVVPAVNSPVAVIVPPPLTTAQVGVTLRTLPLESLTTAVNCCVPPTASVAVVGETVTVAATRVPVESLQAAVKNPTNATARRRRAARARGISACTTACKARLVMTLFIELLLRVT
jgi:hypothetical protein